MGAPQTNHRRQPKGVREGGQFASRTNPESTVSLAKEPDFDGIASAQRAARAYVRRYGLARGGVNGYLDADDFTQEAVMAFLEASTLERTDTTPVPDALVNTIAKRAIVKALGPNNHRDFSAKKLFNERRVSLEKQLGGHLSPQEIEVLAEEIRVSYPMAQRPNIGFHLDVRTRSLNETASWTSGRASGMDGGFDADYLLSKSNIGVEPPVINTGDFAVGSAGDRATMLKMEGQQVAARALAWDAIAEHSGAPTVGDVIGKRAAIRARTEVTKCGGPLVCARKYLSGHDSADGLFAPFGPIDDDAKRAVCEALTRNEDYATELWRVAISQAEGRAA